MVGKIDGAEFLLRLWKKKNVKRRKVKRRTKLRREGKDEGERRTNPPLSSFFLLLKFLGTRSFNAKDK